ncbi:hypothetical protein SAY86_011617 [Trapa natans]|uniref:Aminotransferase class I/classII large domain-containing protein n=1 Tax=Trapa natans TaxID=22666 RepID=A0AAN7LNI7_TRANT|nr:hypothetical protein SAY86_011617 [Trapa natans]
MPTAYHLTSLPEGVEDTMENMPEPLIRWRFKANEKLSFSSATSVRRIVGLLTDSLSPNDPRPVIPLGRGDPSDLSCFRTTTVAEDAIVESARSAKLNGYSPAVGILPARRAVAEYLSKNLPYTLSHDDVFLTVGCVQAIEAITSVLARADANILLPRPGFPYYELRATCSSLEVRHFDLLPERGWEVDLAGVERLADENTVALVLINPGNPSGNVFTYYHLKKVAETARRLGIMVIADEVYAHLAFGSIPFTPMGVFGSITPVITLGSISKRWIVPGWRIGWLVTTDPNGILKKHGVVDSIKEFLNTCCEPATVIQGAIPRILERTEHDFFSGILNILKQTSDICYEMIKDIPCITCPHKPEGAMFVMVKLNLSMLDGVKDDLDFCMKLAKEESVIVLPGIAVGMKNWLRVTIAVEPHSLIEGLERIKVFNKRHAKEK